MRRRRRVTPELLTFERIVQRALDALPPDIAVIMENVAVVVEEEPSPEILSEAGVTPPDTLFGFYQGIPRTERLSSYGMVLPDRVLIFRRPLQDAGMSYGELLYEIRKTVIHEVAHHVGFDDATLDRMGWG